MQRDAATSTRDACALQTCHIVIIGFGAGDVGGKRIFDYEADAATPDVLLTLDRADFEGVMGAGFYGLPVMKPGDFLRRERAAGRLI